MTKNNNCKEFKNFKNVTETSADFYVYGTICDDKDEFWDGDTAIDPNDLKKELEELKELGVKTLNILINSPGGSVFAASAIVSQLQRAKHSGITIKAYVDGICASAATFLAMAADEINVYNNSVLMIHKPWGYACGNTNELQKTIEMLNSVQNNVMLPLYDLKSKVTSDEIQKMVDSETWFNGNVSDEFYVGKFFVVNHIDSTKSVAACADERLFKNYKNLPKALQADLKEKPENELEENSAKASPEVESENNDEPKDTFSKVDLSDFYDTIKMLKY